MSNFKSNSPKEAKKEIQLRKFQNLATVKRFTSLHNVTSNERSLESLVAATAANLICGVNMDFDCGSPWRYFLLFSL